MGYSSVPIVSVRLAHSGQNFGKMTGLAIDKGIHIGGMSSSAAVRGIQFAIDELGLKDDLLAIARR